MVGRGSGSLVGVGQSSAAESEKGECNFGEHGCGVFLSVCDSNGWKVDVLMPLNRCADAVFIDKL